MPDFSLETFYGRERGVVIAGADEAGRGPLAGPVVAAAVIMPDDVPDRLRTGINDSKKLSAKKREELFPLIQNHCVWAIAQASVEEIDRLNILHASLLAMHRALESLSVPPALALIDGHKTPRLNIKVVPVVGGDSKSLSIAAASILAKVQRDHIMQALHRDYPHYSWDKNAAYPTATHRAALEKYGPTLHHRKSFGPVKKLANNF